MKLLFSPENLHDIGSWLNKGAIVLAVGGAAIVGLDMAVDVFPIEEHEYIPTLATTGAGALAFGSLSKFYHLQARHLTRRQGSNPVE